MDIAGHVSRQMLKHYSHIRMQAKREALDAVGKKQQEAEKSKQAEEVKRTQDCSPKSADALKVEGESLQKSLQSGVSGASKHRKAARKPLKRIGSPSATQYVFANGESPARPILPLLTGGGSLGDAVAPAAEGDRVILLTLHLELIDSMRGRYFCGQRRRTNAGHWTSLTWGTTARVFALPG